MRMTMYVAMCVCGHDRKLGKGATSGGTTIASTTHLTSFVKCSTSGYMKIRGRLSPSFDAPFALMFLPTKGAVLLPVLLAVLLAVLLPPVLLPTVLLAAWLAALLAVLLAVLVPTACC